MAAQSLSCMIRVLGYGTLLADEPEVELLVLLGKSGREKRGLYVMMQAVQIAVDGSR